VVELSGKDWSGTLLFNEDGIVKAYGKINGYSWYFQSKVHAWTIEIAEDQTIEPSDLPLVGYGCGGWIHEYDKDQLPKNEADFTRYITTNLSNVFNLFNKNKLTYLPAVTCVCSD
jgi:hypothetical protein